jgi:hypothetical protein
MIKGNQKDLISHKKPSINKTLKHHPNDLNHHILTIIIQIIPNADLQSDQITTPLRLQGWSETHYSNNQTILL